MATTDADAVAALHRAWIPRSLWAELGQGFLARLYRVLVNDPRFVSFVFEESGVVKAFVAASTDTGVMLKETAKANGVRLAVRAWRGLRPSLAWRLVETGRYPAMRGIDAAAEMLFCVVAPEVRRKGVGKDLHEALFGELRARGCARVVVTTESNNEGALGHLGSLGFVEERRFPFYGKEMVLHARAV